MKKIIVIKLGGSSLENPATLRELAKVVLKFRAQNKYVVVVHGGGPAINQELTARGIQWKFLNGQRQTTKEMMQVIDEVLAQNVNSMIVRGLRQFEIPAVGLSGADQEILYCSQASAELMQVGKIQQVHTAVIETVLAGDDGAIPVIAPIGYSVSGEKFNINADWAATQIAIALKAEKLIFLTDQSGILDQNKKLIRLATPDRINKLIECGVISGGMYTKVKAMMTALELGVGKVQVLNASTSSQISDRIGTLLTETKPHSRKDVIYGQAS